MLPKCCLNISLERLFIRRSEGDNKSRHCQRNFCRKLDTPESIWSLHDFLSTERYQYEGRMEFDFSNILFSLADMIKQKLIQYDDLNGLNQLKLSKIKAMSMF